MKIKRSRDTKELYEIWSVLDYYRINNIPFTIWQKTKEGRLIAKASVRELNVAANSVHLTFFGELINFDKSLDFYFYAEPKQFLLKCKPLLYQKRDLFIATPKVVKLEEMRKIARLTTIAIPNCELQISKDPSPSGRTDYNFQMADISVKGFSFIASHSQISLFKVGEKIRVRSIMKDALDEKYQGVIRHVSAYQSSSKVMNVKSIKVGVEFYNKVELDQLFVFQKYLKGN
jgi:hypothetical protein